MFKEFIMNKPLWVAAFGFLTSQVFKFIFGLINGRKKKLAHFFGTGGMPSSHAATVGALSATVGLTEGFGTAYFAIAAIFSSIVVYDATNIRYAAGCNAETINAIVEKMDGYWKNESVPGKLNTHLGHTRVEVVAGVIWGILLAIIIHYFYK